MTAVLYWFVCLMAAHILADFPLQTKKLIQYKKAIWGLLLHGAIHGLLSYVICAQWTLWLLPLLVMVLHASVDFLKKDHWVWFVGDQVIHFIVLTGLVFLLPFDRAMRLSPFQVYYYQALVLLSGILVITMGSGLLIGKIMKRHLVQNHLVIHGLKNGGLWIGYLERFMILILILCDMSAGIGFLIAAKSILRFNDTKEKQKMAEYVLIGTLLSFSTAVLLSVILRFAFKLPVSQP